MSNDLVKFNELVCDMERIAMELAELGRGGFKVPFVTTSDELADMVGAWMGPWRPLSNDLIWFNAIQTIIHGRQMLAEAGRIFEQLDDEQAAQKIEAVLQTMDNEFHPGETALQVYGKLLGRPAHNDCTAGSQHQC